MNENNFTWVPFFEELADCLLQYKDNRKELIALVKQAHDLAGKNLPKIESDNNNIPDIDPFTIYALFNRGKQSTISRSQICQGYKKVFGIKANVPTDYDGIPVYAYNQYCFYRYVDDPKRVENCFELLWALFESAIEYSKDSLNSDRFCEYFEKSLNLPMVGLSKLTMGLYQIRPKTYVNIDRINEPLIETKIEIPKDINDGREYLHFCIKLKDNLQKLFNCDTFFELSFLAFQYSAGNVQGQQISNENTGFQPEIKNNNVGGQGLMEHNESKNIILYGPPGTGKTYNTVRKAVEIIEPDKGWGDKDYKAVKEQYDKLLNEGRINFVTFHQSYGYEEFVQGIKPVVDDEGNVTYEVEDGVFKEFCERAKAPSTEQVRKYELNDTPTLWKVSLMKTGDNEVRKDCLEKGHIRMGYDKYGEDISEITEWKYNGKTVLKAFVEKMNIGDIVLSCYSESQIDAIGVITGGYEWHDEYSHFKRLRKVNWIYKGKKDIRELNGGKTFSNPTVHKLNNMSVDNVLNFVNEEKGVKVDDKSVEAKKGNYVFIIDEINRGNISKIFGELITLIEDNKRDGASEAMKVTLPYKKDGESVSFSVPDNVYIIGTMNTADRSIAAIDTALRRRFTFIEMMPEPEKVLVKDNKHICVGDIDMVEMLKTMNERIAVLYDCEHTIGHAYFMPLKDNPSIDLLADIFRNKIIPLLQEYFYEDYGKIRLVLGDNRKVENLQFIKSKDIDYSDLFGNTDEYELGERSKKYFINNDAFSDQQAYIGIYDPTNA